jgi:hypothetical protein
MAAFRFLEEQALRRGEVLPRETIAEGFIYEGQRVPLIGPQGIFKPALLPETPLSITTVPVVEGKRRPRYPVTRPVSPTSVEPVDGILVTRPRPQLILPTRNATLPTSFSAILR